jgi:hypothetical protein
MINLDDSRNQIAKFIEQYNAKRLHSSLFYLTPDDFFYNRINEKLDVRNTKLLFAKKTRQENGGQVRYDVKNVGCFFTLLN